MKTNPYPERHYILVRNTLYLSDGAPTLFHSNRSLACEFDMTKKADRVRAERLVQDHGGRLFPVSTKF